MIGFYFDENAADLIVVRVLRGLGVTCVTSSDEELLGASDEDQFQRATALGLVMVTSDQGDFMRLHTLRLASGEGHAGLIIIPQKWFPAGERIRRLARIVHEVDESEMRDTVAFLQHWSPRNQV